MKHKVFLIIKRVICTVLFFAIVVSVVSLGSYFFRYEEDSYSTKMIKGFYALDRDSIDVIYIGSSSFFRYNSPLLGYKHTGLTSYNFCSSAFPFEATLTLIKEAEKYQHPSVYVVDVRRFYRQLDAYRSGLYDEEKNREELKSGMSFVVNNMPLSFNRAKLIDDFYGKKLGENSFEWQFDFMRTHDNWKELTWDRVKELFHEATHFKQINALEYGDAFLAAMWKPFERPDMSKHNYVEEISAEEMAPIDEIIEYGNKKGLNILFLNPPCVVNWKYYAYEKFVDNYIREKGGTVLNCNELYDDIGIDFGTDFYNENHLNVSGGIKTTIYVSNIIKNTFDINSKELTSEQKKYWESSYEKWHDECEVKLMEKLQRLIEKGVDDEGKK